MFSLINETKQFEKLSLIVFRDAHTRILNRNFKELCFFDFICFLIKYLICIDFSNNFDKTFLGKLKSIRDKVQYNLLDSLHIRNNLWEITLLGFIILIVIPNVWVLSIKFNPLLISLVFLNKNYLFNGIFNVKFLDVFSEFTSFKLGIIKQVLN